MNHIHCICSAPIHRRVRTVSGVYMQLWYPVVEKLLTTKSGGEPQLLFAGVVDAYPYDRPHAQEWHRDGQALSPEPSAQLQPHCINLFIPLVDITEDVGPTEFWPGTHVEATYHALQKEQKVTQMLDWDTLGIR